MDAKDRVRSLDSAISEIEKAHGKGAILRMGSSGPIVPIGSIPTGSLSIDAALGIGGFPRGRVVEVYGPESSGKTTLALSVVAQAQKLGGVAAFVDAEHAMDPIYAGKIGVDIDNLLVSQPDSGEQALQIVDVLVQSGAIEILVVDSVAALVPRAELEGEMGRPSRRPAGALDVTGAAQIDRSGLAFELLPDLHQPDSREDRRDVREP